MESAKTHPAEVGPPPGQVCTWLADRSGYEYDAEFAGEPSDGQWLYCLKDTDLGDRQIVWHGSGGQGIIAVVDFNGHVRRRVDADGVPMGKYEGWGRITMLRRPIAVERVRSHPDLARRFGGRIQSVARLSGTEALAILALAEGLPAAPVFVDGESDHDEDGGIWYDRRWPPESITEELVLGDARTQRRLGFAGSVNPAGKKKCLGDGTYPDLWSSEAVVGEVKNQVTSAWGPGQIERYIRQCDAEWPEQGPWRGVLVQGAEEMAPSAARRLDESRLAERIEVYSVRSGRRGRIEVEKLYT
jgi:hypothetical protein